MANANAKSLKRHVVRVPRKYAGEYIALQSWRSRKIVAHSKDPAQAYENAIRSGVKAPVLMFIREPNSVCVY